MATSAQPRPAPAYAQPTAPPWSVLALLPRPFWTWLKNGFSYATSFLPLAANGTSTQAIQIQSDAWFVMLSATMVATDTTNGTLLTYRPFTVQIADSGSGANLFNQAIGADEYFGDAQQPGNLAFPYIWKPGATLSVTLVNLDTTNARNVRLTFHGFKANPNLNEDDYPV